MAILEPTQQQQAAARRRLLEHARVPRRPTRGVEQPGMVELLADGSLLARHRDRGDRRADVDQDGCTGAGIANRERVGRQPRLAPAIRGDEAEGRVGGGQDGEIAAVRCLLRKRRQTGDMVAAAHREGHHAVRRDPLERDAERPLHQPQARQVVAVPDHDGAVVPHAFRLAAGRHQPFLELLEIERAQRHPMGVTAQHVGQHQQLGHGLRLRVLHPGSRQEIAGEAGERRDGIASLDHSNQDSPDAGSTGAIVRALIPRSKSSRRGRVVPGSPRCASAAAKEASSSLFTRHHTPNCILWSASTR